MGKVLHIIEIIGSLPIFILLAVALVCVEVINWYLTGSGYRVEMKLKRKKQ
jgi:hypothetical protein